MINLKIKSDKSRASSRLAQKRFVVELTEVQRKTLTGVTSIKTQLVVYEKVSFDKLESVLDRDVESREFIADEVEVVSVSHGELRLLLKPVIGLPIHARLSFNLPFLLSARDEAAVMLSDEWQRLLDFNLIAFVKVDDVLDIDTGIYVSEGIEVFAALKFFSEQLLTD